MGFVFRTSAQVHFGAGEARRAPEIAARFGRRVLLVTGAASLERGGALAMLLDGLKRAGAAATRLVVDREPDTALVDEGAAQSRAGAHDVVLAVGGGSVLDAAKAVAALATNPGAALDYVEEVGGGRELAHDPLPVVAVPTTAGSGSEVTRNAVVRVPHLAVKRSIRSDRMIPRAAVVDPELSATAPRSVAAAAGLDALTHLIEAYVSRGAQPTTDALVLPGIRLALTALRAAAGAASDEGAHEAMALASLWGGIALANAGLGAVHGLAAPLGGRCAVAHGAACGCLLPATLGANLRALRERAPGSAALARYQHIADIVVTHGTPSPERAADDLRELRAALGVPALSSHGVRAEDLPAVVAGSRAGSMKYNPIELRDDELLGVLRESL